MKKRIIFFILAAVVTLSLSAQRQNLNIPDIMGYKTLKCDLHAHTVFSDGDVWPVVRVNEAWRDGLDAIAITDHIEYRPHKAYLPKNHNGAWEVAEKSAADLNIILIHGAEITRSMPPGHFNALFIKDATPLDTADLMVAIGEAVKQGAFIQYNHPGWKPQQKDGIPRLYPIHIELIKKGWLNGIEYFNQDEFYPLVLDMCHDYNLTLTGNSDVHGLISEQYKMPAHPHRPVTLVFAAERTPEALREALFAHRTAIWYDNFLAGSEEYTGALFHASVVVGAPFRDDGKNVWFEVTNNSDLPYELTEGPEGAPASLLLPAEATVIMKTDRKYLEIPLTYKAANIITGNGSVLTVSFKP